ncbi:HypC/HybG/HupF family hydrogenase formation chaperone, partial [Rhodovulum sulfidophilum]|nr:HypC/HybG/HupF family hydrogenase formation chaperone [Rhodovulum sulfidophilum]
MCLGIPGRIVAVTDENRMMALAEVSGVRREVNVA